MNPVFRSMSEDQLHQLVHLLAHTATPALLDRAHRDIDAIGAELWRRTRPAAASAAPPPVAA